MLFHRYWLTNEPASIAPNAVLKILIAEPIIPTHLTFERYYVCSWPNYLLGINTNSPTPHQNPCSRTHERIASFLDGKSEVSRAEFQARFFLCLLRTRKVTLYLVLPFRGHANFRRRLFDSGLSSKKKCFVVASGYCPSIGAQCWKFSA